jgi:alkylhydroperoxidase family enzyme
VTEQQLQELSRYETSPAFNEEERLVIDLTVAMAQTPTDIPRELMDRLRQRFSEPQLVELATSIAFEHYRARFNRVFGVQPSGFSEGAFCAMPETHAQV